MKLSYRVKYNNTWKEIGCYTQSGVRQMGLISSQNTSIDRSLFSRDGKSITNTVSFVLTWNGANRELYQEVLDALLNALDNGSDIECQIMDAERSEALFSGKIDLSGITITSAKMPSKIDLKAKDHIADLDKKINANIVYEDYPVNDIVTSLLAEANAYQAKDLVSSIPATKKCKYFVITSDDNATYRDVIDTLLFEMGGYCLYRYPATDGYEIHKIFKTEEPSHQIHYLVSDSLKTSTGSLKNKGAIVIYPTVSEMANARLYTENINAGFTDDGKLEGEIIKPGEFFPRDGEIQATYQSFDSSFLDRDYQEKRSRLQNSDIDLLYVKADTFNLNVNPSTGFDQPAVDLIGKPSGTQLYPRKAWTLLRNNTNKDINLLSFDMTGTAVYKSKLNRLNLATGSDNPEEYETSYVFSDEDAQAFGEFYKNWLNLKRTTASWSEFQKESSVGDVVVIKHKETDIGQKYVVVEQTIRFVDKANPVYSCIAIALSGYKEYTGYVDTLLDKKKNPTLESSTEQYYYSTSKTELNGGAWLSEPDNDNTNLLWKRTKYTYTNGNVTYSAAYYAGGQDGEQGADGKVLRIIADRTFLRYRENNTSYGDVANLNLQTNLDASKAVWSVDGVAILASDSIVIDSSYFVREWESASTSSTARMRCIYQADGYLLIGGVSGVLVVSKDNGKTWATVSKFASNAITGISSKNGTFVAVDGDGKIYSTTDPEGAWNLVFESGKIFNAVVCDGSVFVAVGETYPGTTGIISKSTDGINWTTVNTECPNFYAICHDGKSFVAIGAGGTAWKSEDGTTWRVAGSTGFDCRGISFNSGKYIAGGAGGQIAYSYNGDTWYNGTVKRNPTVDVSHIRAIASVYGEYYSVCYLSNGYGEIWKSNNGIDWSVCYEPLAANTRIWAVAFIGTGILASGDNGKTYYLELPRSISVEVACEGLSDRTAIYIQQDAAAGAHGDKGTDAIPPKYQWRLGSSSTEPPVDTINHLADGAVSTFDGTVLAETNTGWLDVRPTPTADLPYIWERMSADGGLTWSDPYCLSINTIKNIEVVSSHASFNLNSRGVCETLQTITCSIVRYNTIDPCFWTVTKDGNLTDIVATEGDSITISVAKGETTKNIEVSAVCSGMARAVNIFSKIVGKIVPVNLTHELTGHYNDTLSIPEVFKDGITPVMKGDYIIYYPIDDSTGKEYPTPAVYNGSAWVPVKAETAPDNYSQIMSDTLPDVLASGITVPVVSAYYGYFENLAAQAAVITKLFSEFIKIGGAIYGGAYDENGNNTTGGAGFHLSEKGKLKAEQAELRKAYITGVFECKLDDNSEIIFKTQKGADGAPVSCSAKSRWCMADLFNAINYEASGTGTYNGTSYSYRKCSAAYTWQVYTINVSDTSIWGKEVVAFRTNSAVTIRYSIAGKTVTGAWRETYIKQYSSSNAEKFSKMASRDNETATGTLSLSAGDYITLRAEGSGSYVSANASINIIDDAIVLHSSNIPSLLLKNEMKFYELLTASFGSFDSANNKKYAPITGWFNGFNNNEVATINSSSVSVNGASYSVVGASKTASNLTLYTSEGISLSFDGPADTSEGATIGWYNISGTLQKVSETKGVVTNNLIPGKDDISIGTANNSYASVFATLVQAKNITADGTINITGSGTINGPTVWGAVYN